MHQIILFLKPLPMLNSPPQHLYQYCNCKPLYFCQPFIYQISFNNFQAQYSFSAQQNMTNRRLQKLRNLHLQHTVPTSRTSQNERTCKETHQNMSHVHVLADGCPSTCTTKAELTNSSINSTNEKSTPTGLKEHSCPLQPLLAYTIRVKSTILKYS